MLWEYKTTLLIVLLFLFTCHIRSQLPQAQMDSLVSELSKAKDDTNKVLLLRVLANESGYTDPRKAIDYAHQGLELSKKINYDKGIGMMTYILGFSYGDLGNTPLFDSFLKIAENKFQILGMKEHLAKIDHAKGVQHYKQGNYWLAAEFFSRSVKEFEEANDKGSALIAYQSLIAVLGQVKNHNKAIELGKKALKMAEDLKDTLSVAYSLQALVTDLIYADRLAEAYNYLADLEEVAVKSIDQNISADSYGTLGTYHFRTKNFPTALFYFQKAADVSQQANYTHQFTTHLNSLGETYVELGNLEKGRETLLTSLQQAKELGNKRVELNASLSLSTYFAKTGDFKNAYTHLYHHLEMKDSILKTETAHYTTYLEETYESNKKENEILRLQKAQQEKDFALKRRNAYLVAGMGMIAALMIILYLSRRNFLNRQKLSAQQAVLLEERIKTIEKEQQISSLQSMINGQETERTRIAKDLHDGLGGIFSTVKMHYSTLQQETPSIKENSLYRKTLDLINNASDELRKVAHNMMPEVLMKVGLLEALQDYCNNISSGKLLNITFQTFGMDKRLGSSTEIMLYRIIQELINNIIKHAEATEALVQINREQNRLSLIIEDNGRGFDTSEAEEKRSMGIATVKSRVDYLNGRLTIDSRKDMGTTVMIDLLINEP